MPRYEFRCTVCDKTKDEIIPVSLRDDPDFTPVCCDTKMSRLISSVPFTFNVNPRGQYFPTIDKVVSSETEFQAEAEKQKAEMRKTWIEEPAAKAEKAKRDGTGI